MAPSGDATEANTEAPPVEVHKPDHGYRPDLDGLRAIAITAVVLFHANIAGASGGFVGVDVFLVLSGWLITRQIAARAVDDGRAPNLIDFWLRRVRRLLPAMAVMVATTFLAALLILSPMEMRHISMRGAAAATYVSNIFFALRGGAYFDGPLQFSPYLHTWSLALEEQFYLVWPIIIGAVALVVARASRARRRRSLLLVLGAIAIASFAVNLVLVERNPLHAYYLLPGRMWEFAAGGIAAVALPRRIDRSERWLAAIPVAGLAAIVGAVVWLSDGVAFPGTAALLPVAGTLAIIVGNQTAAGEAGPVARVLSLRPAVALGRLAYSWYLWHWPFMVLGTAALLEDRVVLGGDAPALRLALGIAALGPAMLSLRYVEAPFRRPAWSTRRLRTIVLAGASTIVLLAGAFAVDRAAVRSLASEPQRTYRAVDRSYEHQPCTDDELSSIAVCVAGDPDGSRTIVLAGDSHAWHWVTAFSEAAEDLDVRLVVRFMGNCTAVPTGLGDACDRHAEETIDLVAAIEPDGVVLSDARSSRRNGFESPAAWADAYSSAVERVEAAGSPVGHVIDNPETESPMICLGRGGSASRCSPRTSRAMASTERFAEAEERAQRSDPDRPVLDASTDLCGPERCDVRVDGIWRFAGTSHLSEDYTLSRLPEVRSMIEALAGAA